MGCKTVSRRNEIHFVYPLRVVCRVKTSYPSFVFWVLKKKASFPFLSLNGVYEVVKSRDGISFPVFQMVPGVSIHSNTGMYLSLFRTLKKGSFLLLFISHVEYRLGKRQDEMPPFFLLDVSGDVRVLYFSPICGNFRRGFSLSFFNSYVKVSSANSPRTLEMSPTNHFQKETDMVRHF